MKQCIRCDERKRLDEFAKNKASKDGKCSACKTCMYSKAKEYKKKNRKKMSDYLKRWHLKNPDKHKQYNKQQRLNNPNFKEGHKRRNDKYREFNPHIHRAKWARYHARKLKVCPNWVNQDQLKKIYENCPEGFEVDHIVPLRGENVSGLHVPWNLQYLTRSENASKGNKICLM